MLNFFGIDETDPLGSVRLFHRSSVVAKTLLLLLGVSFGGPIGAEAQGEPAPFVRHIGFVMDEPLRADEEFLRLVRQELLDLTRNEVDVRFLPQHTIRGDGTISGITAALQGLLASGEVDVAATLGLKSSQIAAILAPWPVPVVASTILDAELQGLPFEDGVSGIEGLSYLTIPAPVLRDLEMFRSLTTFRKVDILAEEAALNGVEEFQTRLAQGAAGLGIELRFVPVGSEASETLDSLPPDVEAVYLVPLDHLPEDEFQRLIDGLLERRIPSFTFSGERDVARGIFASLNPDLTPRLARRVAIHLHRILLGDDPSTLPVSFLPGEELVINVRTARALGLTPPLGLLLEAKRLFEAPEDVERTITLKQVMEEVIDANLSLAGERRDVAANAEEIQIARSNLLPTLSIGTTGVLIPESVAAASIGSRAQRSLDGALSFQQLLFSEESRSNLTIQNSLHDSRLQEFETSRLDIILEGSESYLDVLRAQTLEQVQQDNLELTRASLRLADARERIGAAGLGERLRLQSELAERRGNRIDAYAQRRAAEIALNQTLNRPLDEEFLTPESSDGGRGLMEASLFSEFLLEPRVLWTLGDFIVAEARASSPEVRSLDATVQAQERLAATTARVYYSPTIALQGEISTNLFKGGAGAEAVAIPGISATEVTDFPWSLGLSFSLPLFEGTARSARRRQALEDLDQLRLRRSLAVQQVEQRARTQLHFTQASLAIVTESEAAADAARRSLALVTDSYAQGVADVVSLLEAQNAALVTELSVANATYDYLTHLKRLERAIGWFEPLATPDERAALIERLQAFIALSGENGN